MSTNSFLHKAKSHTKIPLTFLLVFSLCMTTFISNSFAAVSGSAGAASQTQVSSGLENHWAKDSMNWLVDEGILKGDTKGNFLPDKAITRAEFTQIAVEVFNYNKEQSISYKDVKTSDWYYSCISRGAAQGFIQGYNGKVQPNGLLSRQDAAVMAAKMLKLSPDTNVSRFPDSSKISSYARGYVGAMAEAGYLKGNDKGNMDPLRPLQRCEAISLLHTVAGQIYRQQGVYDLKHQTIEGNVTVASQGITLKNAVIQGDLYITEGVGTGNVTLDNVEVRGQTLISGGGVNSIVFINTRLGRVSIQVPDGAPVRLVASGDTSIGMVSADSQCKLQEDNLTGAGFGEVVISVPADAKVSLDGTFDKVTMDAANTNLDILGGRVSDLLVTEKAKNADVTIASSARVAELTCEASAYIGGTGKIGKADINSSGVKISQKPDSVYISGSYTATINGSSVSKNTSSSNKKSSSKSSSKVLEYDYIDLVYGKDVTYIRMVFPEAVTLLKDGESVGISQASNIFEYSDGTTRRDISNIFLRDDGRSVEFCIAKELPPGTHRVTLREDMDHTYAFKTVNGKRIYDLQDNNLKVTLQEADTDWSLTGPENVTVEAGKTASFHIDLKNRRTSDWSGIKYQWMKNQVPVSGAVGASYSFTPGINDDNAKLSVQVMCSKDDSDLRICRESDSALLRVTAKGCVLLQPGSQGQAGDQKITDLQPGGRYYIYSEKDQKTYQVKSDGTLGEIIDSIEYEALPSLTGSTITGLSNGQWYKVHKVLPDQKTLIYLLITGGDNDLSFTGSVSPDCSMGTAQDAKSLTLKLKAEAGAIVKVLQNGQLKDSRKIQSSEQVYSLQVALDQDLLNEELYIRVSSDEAQDNPAEYRIRVKRGASPTLVAVTSNSLPFVPAAAPLKYQIKYLDQGMTMSAVEMTPPAPGTRVTLEEGRDYSCTVNDKGNLDVTISGEFTGTSMRTGDKSYQISFRIETDNGPLIKTHNIYRQAFRSSTKVISSGSSYVQNEMYILPSTPGAISLKYEIKGMEETVTFAGITFGDSMMENGIDYTYTELNGHKIVTVSKEFVAEEMKAASKNTEYRLHFQFKETDIGTFTYEKIIQRLKYESAVTITPQSIVLGSSPAAVELICQISNMEQNTTVTGVTVTNSYMREIPLEAGTDYTLAPNEDGTLTLTIAAAVAERHMKSAGTYYAVVQFVQDDVESYGKSVTVIRQAPPPAPVEGEIVLGEPEMTDYAGDNYLAVYVPMYLSVSAGAEDTIQTLEGENSSEEAEAALQPITREVIEDRVLRNGQGVGYIVFKKNGQDLNGQATCQGKVIPEENGVIILIESLSQCSDYIFDSTGISVKLSVIQPPNMNHWAGITPSGPGISLAKSQITLNDFELAAGVSYKSPFDASKERQTLLVSRMANSPIVAKNSGLSYMTGGYTDKVTMKDASSSTADLYITDPDPEIEWWIAEKNKLPVLRAFDLEGAATVPQGKAILKHEVYFRPDDNGSYTLELCSSNGQDSIPLEDTKDGWLDWDNTLYSLGKKADGTPIQVSLKQLMDSEMVTVDGDNLKFSDIKRLFVAFNINPSTDQIYSDGIHYTPKLKSGSGISYHPMDGAAAFWNNGGSLKSLTLLDSKGDGGSPDDELKIGDLQANNLTPVNVSVKFSEASLNFITDDDCDVEIFEGIHYFDKGQTLVLKQGEAKFLTVVVIKNGGNTAPQVYRFAVTCNPSGENAVLKLDSLRSYQLNAPKPDVEDEDTDKVRESDVINMDRPDKDKGQSQIINMDKHKQEDKSEIIDMDTHRE